MTAVKLVLIGVDGLRVDDALRPGVAPELAGLVRRGSSVRMRMPVPTVSGPGWATLLTGATHAQHAVVDNTFRGHRLHHCPDLLTRAHYGDPTRTTFAACSWPPLVDPAGPGPVVRTRIEQQRAEQHRVVVRDGETYGYRWADGEVTAWATFGLRTAGPDVSFVYLGEVDEAGHLYGGASDEYQDAVGRVDARIGEILAVLHGRAAEHDEDWLVAVTTDHGHLDEDGHGGGQDVVTASFLAVDRIGRRKLPAPSLPGQLEPHEVVNCLLGMLVAAPR